MNLAAEAVFSLWDKKIRANQEQQITCIDRYWIHIKNRRFEWLRQVNKIDSKNCKIAIDYYQLDYKIRKERLSLMCNDILQMAFKHDGIGEWKS